MLGQAEPWHYRNKAIATFATGPRGRLTCGIYAAGTHRVLPYTDCLLQDTVINQTIAAVLEAARACRWPAFEEVCTMKLSRSLIGRGKLSDCCDYFGIANEDAHSALSDAHATALLLGRLLEADPNWPGFQRRLESAADAAEQWPTFAALPKGQWLPRGTHAAAHAS